MALKLEDLAHAIAQFEGFFKLGSVAQRNNNPGNLRAGPKAKRKDKRGYAVYDSPEDGWADLKHQIQLDIDRGLTLAQFLNKYAPPSENPTDQYTFFVAGRLGIPMDVPLQQLAATEPETT